jgi:hypothetical protein
VTEPARSYVADGRVVHWHPPRSVARWRFAIDAELADQPVPAALAHRTGTSEPERFWPRWTAMEVACKLCDVPVVRWLQRYGLDGPRPYGLTIVTGRHGDVVVARGVAARVHGSALSGRIAVVDGSATTRSRSTGRTDWRRS